MRSLQDLPTCSPPPSSLPLLLDGPLSTTVILLGITGNIYCVTVLFRSSINIGMLISLTALAVWDVILLLASLCHHSLWATLHAFGLYPWLWDTYKVALEGLVECAHLTSTWMLLQVSATRFFAVSRPFQASRSKARRAKFAKVAIGLIRMPLVMTIAACLLTIPCSFEYVLRPCINQGAQQFEREENGLGQNILYFLLYKTLLLAFVKTFGPFSIIAFLTVRTLRSMRKSMNSRANILKQQGKGLLFEVDKDKTKSLQTISTLLLGKFLVLRCWPTFVAVMRVLLDFDNTPDISRVAEFMLLLNSATNSFVFVVIKSAFETRRLKRIRTYQRELVMRHAEQVLSIGRMLAVKHDSEGEPPDLFPLPTTLQIAQ